MKKLIFTIIYFFIIYRISYSQDFVKVILKQPPPYMFNVSSLWNVTLINNTNNDYNNIYLYATAELFGKGIIVDATTASNIQLSPGQTKTVNASLIQPVMVDYPNENSNFQSVVETTNSFPEGEYEICIQAKIGNDIIGDTCIPVNVQNLSQVQLISPVDGSGVVDLYPVFSWLPPSTLRAGANLNYTLSIYEILSRQTPYNAVQSNRAFFNYTNIKTSVFRYPAVSRPFLNNQKYAVQVTAYVDTYLISQSEIFEFTYNDSLVTGSNETTDGNLLKNKDLGMLTSSANRMASKKNALKFGITSDITFDASSNSGTYSELKDTYGRIDIIPTLTVYDIPFSLDLFYASDQNDILQNMNSAAAFFTPQILKDFLEKKIKARINALKDDVERKVKEYGEKYRDSLQKKAENDVMKNLSSSLKLFSQFQNLGIGKNYPKYTDYTLSGVPVTGLDVEFNPGLFYIALSGPFNNTAVKNQTYKRNLYSGRIGVGKKDNSHLFFTMMYAEDDAGSIAVDPENTALTPKSDYVLATEGKLNFMNDQLKFGGEVGVSVYNDDTQAPAMEGLDIPEFITNLVNPTTGTRYGIFYTGEVSFDNPNSNTSVKGGVKMIPPGYLTLGNPSKKNDFLEFNISADQKFYNNQLTAKVGFKTGHDNLLDGFKNYTTTNSLLNISLSARFRNYPSVQLNYLPVFLSNNATRDSLILDNNTQNLIVVTSYPFKFSNINNNASLLFTLNTTTTHFSEYDNSNWNLNFTNSMSFNSPFTLTGSFGMLRGGISDTLKNINYTNTYTFNLNGGYTFFDTWNNQLGFTLTTSPDQNNNLSIFFNSSSQIFKYFSFNMRLENTIYKDNVNSVLNYNNLIFNASVSAYWE